MNDLDVSTGKTNKRVGAGMDNDFNRAEAFWFTVLAAAQSQIAIIPKMRAGAFLSSRTFKG
jgi:hypothetical protein